jgi:hypothetical protein
MKISKRSMLIVAGVGVVAVAGGVVALALTQKKKGGNVVPKTIEGLLTSRPYVYLKAANGQYLSCNQGLGVDGQPSASKWERWTFEPSAVVSGALHMRNDKWNQYMTAEDDGSVDAKSWDAGGLQSFVVKAIDGTNTKITLMGSQGKYVGVDSNGAVINKATTPGSSEVFEISF